MPNNYPACLIIPYISALLSLSTGQTNRDQQLLAELTREHQTKCPAKYLTASCEYQQDSIPNDCCGYCSCETDCKRYGDCCLSQYDTFNQGYHTVANNTYDCVPTQYFLESTNHTTQIRVWMVTKCKSTTTDDINVDMCINPGDDAAVDSIVPVTDLTSMTHFKNRFCAYCNGVAKNSALVYWQSSIYNDRELLVTDKNLLSKLRQQHGNIIFEPPNFMTVTDCKVPPYHISKCNVTGDWATYDRAIESACDAFVDPFNFTYKNYFCYRCNTQPPYLPLDNLSCVKWSSEIEDITPPFFAILDVSDPDEKTSEKKISCNTTAQFADYKKMICRDIQCQKSSELINGRCVTKGQENMTCYETFIKLTWLQDTPPLLVTDTANFLFRDSLEEAVREKISKWLDDELMNLHVFGSLNTRYEMVQLVMYFTVKVDTVDPLVALDGTTISIYFDGRTDFRVQSDVYNVIHDGDHSFILPMEDTSVNILPLLYKNNYMTNECLGSTSTLTKLHVCPFITIDINDIALHFENKLMVIDEGPSNQKEKITISRWLYETQGQKISLCLDTFVNIYNTIQVPHLQSWYDNTAAVQAKQIVSFVCVCFSLICLFITVVTYIKLSVLQSQPGINNMILCIFLFLAQAVYQFGAGQRSLPSWACAVVGAVCHFLWLTVMFSMNACSLHMFSIFKKHRKIPPRFSIHHTIRYLVYTVSMSLLFVLVNMIISLTVRNDTSGGYGGKVCYISSNLMQIITFIIPTATTLSINILLFSYVVFRISKISSEASQLHPERNYFLIYVRLSTLTGITWIFGFIQLFLTLELLEYIFIILNASQGVFIMIAFLMNKRVFSVCCAKDLEIMADQTQNKDESKGSS